MKSRPMTEAEMGEHIARFQQLVSQWDAYAELGFPKEVFQLVSANVLYNVMSPAGGTGATAAPAITGAPGLAVGIMSCPPGDGPMLHAHMETNESFMPLTGTWAVSWGDNGEFTTELHQFDLIAVPVGAARQLRNVSESDALLLTLVQGSEQLADIYYAPEVGQEIVARFGVETKAKLEKIGYSFELGV
jgi:uncharacterized RmlC-like cupin family protein